MLGKLLVVLALLLLETVGGRPLPLSLLQLGNLKGVHEVLLLYIARHGRQLGVEIPECLWLLVGPGHSSGVGLEVDHISREVGVPERRWALREAAFTCLDVLHGHVVIRVVRAALGPVLLRLSQLRHQVQLLEVLVCLAYLL